MTSPRISVIMACHNGEKYMDTAIRSILEQTFTDFELIVVEDASTDTSAERLQNWIVRDTRLRVLENPTNMGLAASLNRAVEQAQGKYIARMDVDDIALPRRLEHQLAVLEHQQIDLCGTWMIRFGQGPERLTRYPVSQREIRTLLLFQSAFCHPSVMGRAEIFRRFRYRPDAGIAEDYDLWTRMAMNDVRMCNLPEVLMHYRCHATQVSEQGQRTQAKRAREVRARYQRAFGIECDAAEAEAASRIRQPFALEQREWLPLQEAWLRKLAGHLPAQGPALQLVGKEWMLCCLRAAHFGYWTWRRWRDSPLRSLLPADRAMRMRLLTACSLRMHFGGWLHRTLDRLGAG